MDIKKILESGISRMNPRIASWVFKTIKTLPPVKKKIQKEYDAIMKDADEGERSPPAQVRRRSRRDGRQGPR